jgi:transposase
MVKIVFSEDEVAKLQDIASNHSHHCVRRRAMALILKNLEMKHCKIAEALNISENVLRTYFKDYLRNGISGVTILNFRKPTGKLSSFETEVKKYLEQTPPASIKQACDEIAALTGIRLKETQMRHYLKSLGADFRKVCGIPAKADVARQKEFLDTELQPRLDDAVNGKRTVHFVDSAHFVLGGFLGFLWSLTRILVKTPSGRQRFNVLGALNAITKELITVTNNTYITSIQVCELLVLITQKSTGPVTVVLDNARYQRCKVVTELAEKLNIELLFLPPYSPNLNLIERVWKFTKKQCLNSRYYSDFELFRNTIYGFLTNMHNTHATELRTLLTLKFQLFTEEQINRIA